MDSGNISPSPKLDNYISIGRATSVDVSRLDKINAIPNKTSNRALLDELSPEDRQYLHSLADCDSSTDGDEPGEGRGRSSGWSPMLGEPVIFNKRAKRLRAPYTITLSLEDISYIRPSWGISKGIRTIEITKSKRSASPADNCHITEPSKTLASWRPKLSHCCVLIMFILVGLFMILPSYVTRQRLEMATAKSRFRLNVALRTIEFLKPAAENEASPRVAFKLRFGHGLPDNLKPHQCSCNLLESTYMGARCATCLDWPMRANLRVVVEQPSPISPNELCYGITWRSYDALATPIEDCFALGDDHWFGLGDLKANTAWPLERLDTGWTQVQANISAEFERMLHFEGEPQASVPPLRAKLTLGSYAQPSFLSTAGVFVGDVQSDFMVWTRIGTEPQSGSKRACLSVSCTDRCTVNWLRRDRLDELRYRNNMLEYRICVSSAPKASGSRQLARNSVILARQAKAALEQARAGQQLDSLVEDHKFNVAVDEIQQTSQSQTFQSSSHSQPSTTPDLAQPAQPSPVEEREFMPKPKHQAEPIGLVERTIFATSIDFMPQLDSQSVRQHVDTVVKLGLKNSAILLLDSRWQSYAGSLKLNTIAFPKAKLFFEILHNKGFKIVLTVKPYVDVSIGVTGINQLLELNLLYAAAHSTWSATVRDQQQSTQLTQNSESSSVDFVMRRESLFSLRNETINLAQPNKAAKFAYLFKCRESRDGYCALIDLGRPANRAWLVANVRRTNSIIRDVDAIKLAGTHPDGYLWQDHYRSGLGKLAQSLHYEEKLFTIPQYTGDFGYIELAPRPFSWVALRSTVNSVLNLGPLGFALVHPGSVWGDISSPDEQFLRNNNLHNQDSLFNVDGVMFKNIASKYRDIDSAHKAITEDDVEHEELYVRWLQVAVFMPILQFNNLAPIERHNLGEMLQNLTQIRKLHIVPELKKHLPYTPLIEPNRHGSVDKPNNFSASPEAATTLAANIATKLPMPVLRPVWLSQENKESIIGEQFTVGPDILVAPILAPGQRLRDIYLPSGFWRDELRQVNIRGGKWLRNYPVELNEVAWFTRSTRR